MLLAAALMASELQLLLWNGTAQHGTEQPACCALLQRAWQRLWGCCGSCRHLGARDIGMGGLLAVSTWHPRVPAGHRGCPRVHPWGAVGPAAGVLSCLSPQDARH